MNKYIKSPIFYMGNKYRLLPQLIPLFPTNINTFYDLFGGSGCMSGNVESKHTVYNEINDNIVNLYKLFLKYSPEEIDKRIKEYIKQYNLNTEGTDVRQNNPDIKEIRDFYNNRYLEFRKAYNDSERDYLMLYTLTFYSFSNLIRFNGNNDFNMPYGNRCYCEKHYEQIKKWFNLLKNKDIKIKQENAFDILQDTMFDKDDFIYLDPPYSNTLAIYNEKRAFGGWTIEDDLRKIFNNCKATHNLINIQQVHAKDLEMTEREQYNYIWTYSFPCQDLSLAGKTAGMKKGSGTRSGMLWEVERILEECGDNLPQILLMENVPQVVSKKNKEDFDTWVEFLESKGYTNKWCMLNAKEVGYPEPIPQNRNRCFMVSVFNPKGEIIFPEKSERKLVLKDLLESDVDEKYYLSDKQIKSLESGSYNASKPSVKLEITDKGLSQTLDTMSGGNRQPLVRVGNKSLQETLEKK